MEAQKAFPEKPPLCLRTSDIDEAVAAVSSVYCAHDVKIVGSNRGIEARLNALSGARQQFVSLSYSAPVKIDAGNFDGLMLLMTCAEGSANVRQQGKSRRWTRGHTMPLSPGLRTQLEFDRTFCQHSVRLGIPLLEETCARLLNRPLDAPLRFHLAPFSDSLEQVWHQAVQMILKLKAMPYGQNLTATSLEELLATLVLENHPHNYSRYLSDRCAPVPPRIVREAETLMRSAPPGTTVGAVAKALGVSLRSLELGFREWKASSPTGFMRRLRLEAAKAELQEPSEATTVTSVAVSNGFLHLARFSAYYRSVFNELPSQTLLRNRRRPRSPGLRQSDTEY